MTEYVVGFMFSRNLEQVLLINKEKPEWQKGFKNGIGGKIEPGENHRYAMCREFKEETGMDADDWDYIVTMSGIDWRVFVYATEGDIQLAQTMESEKIEIVDVCDLGKVISNLFWLIPMCLDSFHGKIDYVVSNNQP